MLDQVPPTAVRTRLRPDLLVNPPRNLPRMVDVLGAGRAVRAMLTVAALQGSTCHFRIWCRSHSRAELLAVHLADLPPLSVEINVVQMPQLAGDGPVVLALGLRTSRRSRQKSKDALFSENMAIIDGLMPRLAGRTVIVVTNPSTRLTARLCSEGVRALGIGVMNDQLRFERDAPADVRLVGAHNPFELGFGVLGPGVTGHDLPDHGRLAFSRAAYRDLTNRQDRQRPLLDPDGILARLTPGLHENAWRDLGIWQGGLDLAKRWYARQRLASRYLENGIACGRAILGVVDFVTGASPSRPDLTVEAPMRFGDGPALVMGWPLDTMTGHPRAMAFDEVSIAVIKAAAASYRLDLAGERTDELMLTAVGAPSLRCAGSGLDELVADIVPLADASPAPATALADIDIRLIDDPLLLRADPGAPGAPPQQIAQHRGKNAFEHRDLTIRQLDGGRRLIDFSVSGARALVDDACRQITIAVNPGVGRRDEFRKLVRDQILTPAYAARGAWVLHAGLVRYRGAGLLLLGDSGAGKTTGALHLLAGGTADQGGHGYGASERVLVFAREGRLMALGVPESLTVFRGSLRGLSAFTDLVDLHDPAHDWMRAHKLRLSRDDVVSRLGSYQIAEPIAVSHVALVRYAPDVSRTSGLVPVISEDLRREALHANDLTTQDDVRAAWLGWFEPARDPAVPALLVRPSLPFVAVNWSTPPALVAALAAQVVAAPR